MNVIAIDVSGKPADVPDSKWIKLNTPYTIDKIEYMHQQGIMGCTLVEIQGEFPYTHFALSRFRELQPDEVNELVNVLETENV